MWMPELTLELCAFVSSKSIQVFWLIVILLMNGTHLLFNLRGQLLVRLVELFHLNALLVIYKLCENALVILLTFLDILVGRDSGLHC